MKKWIVAIAPLFFLAQAQAAQIEPRCKVMGTAIEQTACTCAVQNGGYVKHVHGIWRYNYPRVQMDAVHACVKANGG